MTSTCQNDRPCAVQSLVDQRNHPLMSDTNLTFEHDIKPLFSEPATVPR